MAVSRLSQQSLQNAFPKGNTIWDGTTATSAFDTLGSVYVTSATSSITFSNIPQTYQHLQIRGLTRTTRVDNADGPLLRVGNGSIDTGANYSIHGLKGSGTDVSSSYSANTSYLGFGDNPAANSTSGIFGVYICEILDYSNTGKHKTSRTFNAYERIGAGEIRFTTGAWRNTNAIDTIRVFNEFGNHAQYSCFTLYGIK